MRPGAGIASMTAAAGILFTLLVFGPRLQAEGTPPRELTLQSVTPARGLIGEDLRVVLQGSGFDRRTRVSLTLDSGNRKSILATFPSWGQVKAVAFTEDLVLIANQARRLIAIDVSVPSRPRLLGSMKISGMPAKIALAGKTAWLATGDGGVLAVDFSDPGNLRIVGSLELGGKSTDIAIVGHLAAVANTQKGLQLLDIRDPSRPLLQGELAIPGIPLALAVKGNLVYVCDRHGLQIISIEDPGRMHAVGTLPLTGPIVALHLEEDTAFAVSRNTFHTIDIGDPAHPALLASFATPGGRALALRSGRAYMAGNVTGLEIFSVQDPKRPEPLGTVELPEGAQCLALGRNEAYLGTAFGGLQVVDIRHPRPPQDLGGKPVPVPGSASGGRIFKDKAFLTINKNSVQLAEFDTPGAPRFRGAIRFAESIRTEMDASGNFLYVPLSRGGISIIDISDPDLPVQAGRIETSGIVNDLAAAGGMLYAAEGAQGLRSYDIRNPEDPRPVARIETSLPANALAIDGNFLYLGEKGGLSVFDIRRPERPERIGGALLPWHMRGPSNTRAIVVRDGKAYVADGWNGLLIFGLEIPARPRLLGLLDLRDFAWRISVDGRRVYLSTAQKGIHVVDVGNPMEPQLIACLGTRLQNQIIAVNDGSLFLLDPGRIRAVPPPVELKGVRALDDHRLEVTIPSPSLSGTYTLRVFSGRQADQLDGAVVFGPD